MPTRMKTMKLLQELRGMVELANRQPWPRPNPALMLQLRPPASRKPSGKRRRVIQVRMQEPPDIPYPVAIRHIAGPDLSDTAATLP
jgi:hypothetical protein